jgi:dTDP-4-amino-4,6-dideoxygalactose transaminase
MSEVSAAMGLTGLESLNDFVAANQRNYNLYRSELSKVPGVKLIDYNTAEKCNCQYVVAEVDDEKSGLSRDRLIATLHAENVWARKYFYPGCHRMEPYRSYFPHASLLLPNTEKVASQVMVLPTGTAVSEQEITAVSRIIRLAVANAAKVNEYFDAAQNVR